MVNIGTREEIKKAVRQSREGRRSKGGMADEVSCIIYQGTTPATSNHIPHPFHVHILNLLYFFH